MAKRNEKWERAKELALQSASKGVDQGEALTLGEAVDPASTARVNSANSFDAKVLNGYGRPVDPISGIEDFRAEVEEILQRKGVRLNLQKYLHPRLSVGLDQVAAAMPTRSEMLLTALLPIASSLIGTSSVLHIKSGHGWYEPAILWTAGVEKTGKLKTPTFNTLFKPLLTLQRSADLEHKRGLRLWKEAKARAEKNKEEFVDPEPVPKEFWIQDSTMEALAVLHEENPRGVLLYKDELDSFYAGQNKYRQGGGGDDEQNWLSANAGGPIKQRRMTRRTGVSQSAISITGTIQPETLDKHLGGSKDTSGMNARWLYCATEMPSPYPTFKTVDVDLDLVITDLYKKLAAIEAKFEPVYNDEGEKVGEDVKPWIYRFSQEALDYWTYNWHIPIVREYDRESHPGIQAALSKYKGFCGRIALVLHLINYALSLPSYEDLKYSGQRTIIPPLEIGVETVRSAIELTWFYVEQLRILYGVSNPDSEEWTPTMLRLKEISERMADKPGVEGWLTPRIAKQQTKLIKNADHAKELFSRLHEAGFGALDTSGKTPKWKYTQNGSTGLQNSLNVEDLDVSLVDPRFYIPSTNTQNRSTPNGHPTNTTGHPASPVPLQSGELWEAGSGSDDRLHSNGNGSTAAQNGTRSDRVAAVPPGPPGTSGEGSNGHGSGTGQTPPTQRTPAKKVRVGTVSVAEGSAQEQAEETRQDDSAEARESVKPIREWVKVGARCRYTPPTKGNDISQQVGDALLTVIEICSKWTVICEWHGGVLPPIGIGSLAPADDGFFEK